MGFGQVGFQSQCPFQLPNGSLQPARFQILPAPGQGLAGILGPGRFRRETAQDRVSQLWTEEVPLPSFPHPFNLHLQFLRQVLRPDLSQVTPICSRGVGRVFLGQPGKILPLIEAGDYCLQSLGVPDGEDLQMPHRLLRLESPSG